MIERKEKYWEVTIKCLVRTKDINDEGVTKEDVKDSMSLNFDQIKHIRGDMAVK